MKKDWTIDTNVLFEAARNNMSAVEFLAGILRKNQAVSFDIQRHIDREYQRCIKKIDSRNEHEYDGRGFVKKWFVEIVSKNAQRLDGRLSHERRQHLKKLKFHDDDFPFIGVASRTESKDLVTEDTDYSEEIIGYLKSELDISVLNLKESLRK